MLRADRPKQTKKKLESFFPNEKSLRAKKKETQGFYDRNLFLAAAEPWSIISTPVLVKALSHSRFRFPIRADPAFVC